jgi:AraC-like DNA-binding protein
LREIRGQQRANLDRMSIEAALVASGEGWRVRDVVCTHGPEDRAFEERHGSVSIAAVIEGTFQYRTEAGAATLVPGALLLGNSGTCYECGHAHGRGDRCLAFHFDPAMFEQIAAEIPGVRRTTFTRASLPQLLPVIAEAQAAQDDGDSGAFEELTLRVAAAALTLQNRSAPATKALTTRHARQIDGAARRIAADPDAPLTLASLASEARMSRFGFLRAFRQIVGVTPYQYLLRMRLQRAALRLRTESASITSIAYGAGFNDLSTFNRRFHRIMGMTPRAWRSRR